MAHESFPNHAHNNRAVTLAEHEQIAVPLGLSGLLNYTPTVPLFADSSGRQVKLRSGVSASIRGTRFNNTSETVVSIPANTSGHTRIDLVVLRLRRAESSTGAGDQYTIYPHVIQGTPAQQPSPPSPVRNTGTTGFFDVPLAEVTVVNGASNLAADTVVPRHYYIAGSGYTGRNSWARPPVEPGLIFRANDVGIAYIGTASGTWHRFADDSGPLTFPVNNISTSGGGWAAPEFNHLRRVNGQVILNISPQRTGPNLAPNVYNMVGRFPVGFRPEAAFEGLAHAPSSGPGRYRVKTDGAFEVYMYGGLDRNRFVNISPIIFFVP